MAVIYHDIEADNGDLVDLIPFCCNNCPQQWCVDNEKEYPGQQIGGSGSDGGEWCANCGVICSQPVEWDACHCGDDNVLVNRFRVDEAERCEHGLVIQGVVDDVDLTHLAWVMLDTEATADNERER